MRRLLLLLLSLVALAACVPKAAAGPPVPRPRLAAYAPGNGRFFYAAGTAGTVTVAAGSYVTGLSCHATGAGATLTITPAGPDVTVPVAGPAIPIPAGGALSLSRPLLLGNSDELGTGSILVFAGTDAYVVTFYQAGGQ
jgi:hypothetical protein